MNFDVLMKLLCLVNLREKYKCFWSCKIDVRVGTYNSFRYTFYTHYIISLYYIKYQQHI